MKKLLSCIAITLTCSFFAGFSTLSRANALEELEKHLAQAKGKVVYVDFWASWCKPCRHSFPWMNEIKSKYKAQGLEIITVNLDKERHLSDRFLKENPANFLVLYDPEGITAKQFHVEGMPMSFTFDRSGKPYNSHVGFNKKKQSEYERELIQLLATTLPVGEKH